MQHIPRLVIYARLFYWLANLLIPIAGGKEEVEKYWKWETKFFGTFSSSVRGAGDKRPRVTIVAFFPIHGGDECTDLGWLVYSWAPINFCLILTHKLLEL